MLLTLASDLAAIILLSVALGGAGGLAFDVAMPLKRGGPNDGADFDNRVTLPRRVEPGTLDFGFLGPIFVGAVAAVAAVFFGAVTRLPPSQAAVVEIPELIWIALVAGFGGSAVLATLRTTLLKRIERKAEQAADAVIDKAVGAARNELIERIPNLCKELSKTSADDVAHKAAGHVEEAIRRAAGLAVAGSAQGGQLPPWRRRGWLRRGVAVAAAAILVAGVTGGALFAARRTSGSAPRVETVPSLAMSEGETEVVEVKATDPDGDAMTLSARGLPPFASFTDKGDGLAELVLSPGFRDANRYQIVVVASDGSSTAIRRLLVTVTNSRRQGTNQLPVLEPIPAQELLEGEVAEILVGATDPEGDSVLLSVSSLLEFATFETVAPGQGILTLAPGFGDAGTYVMEIGASDLKHSRVSTVSVDVVVLEAGQPPRNQPPVLDPIESQVLSGGEERTVPISATDADGDAITLSQVTPLGFAEFTASGDGTAVLVLKPGCGDAGEYPITIVATDGQAEDTQIVFVTVQECPVDETDDDVGPSPALR